MEDQQRRTSLTQDSRGGAVQRVLSLTRASAKAVDKLAGSGHSETITGSKPSDAGKHDLLLRLFESQWFSPSMALHYLQNPQPGVEDYLCNKLYAMPEPEVERYLLQFVYLAVSRPGSALERTIIAFCSKSFTIAVKVFWLLLAMSQDNPKPKHIDALRDKCERAALEGNWDVPFRVTRLDPLSPEPSGTLTPHTPYGFHAMSPVLSPIMPAPMDLPLGSSPPQHAWTPVPVLRGNTDPGLSFPFGQAGSTAGANNISGTSPPTQGVLGSAHGGPSLRALPKSPFGEQGADSTSTPRQPPSPGRLQKLRQELGEGEGVTMLLKHSSRTRNGVISVTEDDLVLSDDEMSAATPMSPISRLRRDTFGATLEFVESLCDASASLTCIPQEERHRALRAALEAINRELEKAARRDVAVWFPMGRRNERVLRIAAKEAVLLNSRDKAPFMLCVEVLETDDEPGPSDSSLRASGQWGSLPTPQPSMTAQASLPHALPSLAALSGTAQSSTAGGAPDTGKGVSALTQQSAWVTLAQVGSLFNLGSLQAKLGAEQTTTTSTPQVPQQQPAQKQEQQQQQPEKSAGSKGSSAGGGVPGTQGCEAPPVKDVQQPAVVAQGGQAGQPKPVAHLSENGHSNALVIALPDVADSRAQHDQTSSGKASALPLPLAEGVTSPVTASAVAAEGRRRSSSLPIPQSASYGTLQAALGVESSLTPVNASFTAATRSINVPYVSNDGSSHFGNHSLSGSGQPRHQHSSSQSGVPGAVVIPRRRRPTGDNLTLIATGGPSESQPATATQTPTAAQQQQQQSQSQIGPVSAAEEAALAYEAIMASAAHMAVAAAGQEAGAPGTGPGAPPSELSLSALPSANVSVMMDTGEHVLSGGGGVGLKSGTQGGLLSAQSSVTSVGTMHELSSKQSSCLNTIASASGYRELLGAMAAGSTGSLNKPGAPATEAQPQGSVPSGGLPSFAPSPASSPAPLLSSAAQAARPQPLMSQTSDSYQQLLQQQQQPTPIPRPPLSLPAIHIPAQSYASVVASSNKEDPAKQPNPQATLPIPTQQSQSSFLPPKLPLPSLTSSSMRVMGTDRERPALFATGRPHSVDGVPDGGVALGQGGASTLMMAKMAGALASLRGEAPLVKLHIRILDPPQVIVRRTKPASHTQGGGASGASAPLPAGGNSAGTGGGSGPPSGPGSTSGAGPTSAGGSALAPAVVAAATAPASSAPAAWSSGTTVPISQSAFGMSSTSGASDSLDASSTSSLLTAGAGKAKMLLSKFGLCRRPVLDEGSEDEEEVAGTRYETRHIAISLEVAGGIDLAIASPYRKSRRTPSHEAISIVASKLKIHEMRPPLELGPPLPAGGIPGAMDWSVQEEDGQEGSEADEEGPAAGDTTDGSPLSNSQHPQHQQQLPTQGPVPPPPPSSHHQSHQHQHHIQSPPPNQPAILHTQAPQQGRAGHAWGGPGPGSNRGTGAGTGASSASAGGAAPVAASTPKSVWASAFSTLSFPVSRDRAATSQPPQPPAFTGGKGSRPGSPVLGRLGAAQQQQQQQQQQQEGLGGELSLGLRREHTVSGSIGGFLNSTGGSATVTSGGGYGGQLQGSGLQPAPSVGPVAFPPPCSIKLDAQTERRRREAWAVYGERWAHKVRRLKRESPHGKRKGWAMRCIIVKSGDDCRQELLAIQLIRTFADIFNEAGLPLFVRHYNVLVTSNKTALIEVVTDSLSIHSVKHRSPPGASLSDHFFAKWPRGTPECLAAQRNFTESLAAYSIICYMLQIKDRHNGNLLLDDEGRIVHIDFGFMLSNSPGGVSFEAAPFKLTRELLEVMDSNSEGRPSELFDYFKVLMILGFLACRKHHDRILLLAKLMAKSGLPCYKTGERAVKALEKRFALQLTEKQSVQLVLSLISDSLDAWYTRQYDYYQRLLNGIL